MSIEDLEARVSAIEHELTALRDVLGLQHAPEVYAKLDAINAHLKAEAEAERAEKIGGG